MSVFKRNGVGKYYIQFNYNGKTYCRSSKTTNKRTAERIEREWKSEIQLIEELGERPRIKLRNAFAHYLDQKLSTKGHQYVQTNVNAVNERFNVDMYVDEIRYRHLSNFKSLREKEGAVAQTIKYTFQVIRNAIAWAKDHGYLIKQVDFPKLKLPKHRLRYRSDPDCRAPGIRTG